jgi:hypothetical protein
MNRRLMYGAIFIFVALAACTPEPRNYGTSAEPLCGSAGVGSGGASASSSAQGASSAVSGAGGAGPIAAACDAYGFDMCTRYEVCNPVAITANFGDFETCHERYSLSCTKLLTAKGTAWTPAQLEQCGESFAKIGCDQFLAYSLRSADAMTPEPCVPPKGALIDGEPCVDAAQCKGGRCRRPEGSACGVCGPPSNIGKPCFANRDCIAGAVCVIDRCVKAGEIGQDCVPEQVPCNAPLACVNHKCAAPLAQGEACGTPNVAPCDARKGLFCNTATDQCDIAIYSKLGGTCSVKSDAITLCEGSGHCGETGLCEGAAPEGVACEEKAGTRCMAPAVCASGACALPDAATCP